MLSAAELSSLYRFEVQQFSKMNETDRFIGQGLSRSGYESIGCSSLDLKTVREVVLGLLLTLAIGAATYFQIWFHESQRSRCEDLRTLPSIHERVSICLDGLHIGSAKPQLS